jgi:uncharacterized protein
MSRYAAAVLAFLAFAPAPFARAAEPAEPLAVQLSRFVLPEENWNRAIEGVTAQVQGALEQQLEAAGGAEFRVEVQAAVAAEMKLFFTYQEIVDLQAGLLAKHYTDDELREVFAFYRTPVGQKAIRIMPEVAQDLNGLVMARIQERMPAMMARLKPIIEKAVEKAAGKEDAAPEPAPAKPARKPSARAK